MNRKESLQQQQNKKQARYLINKYENNSDEDFDETGHSDHDQDRKDEEEDVNKLQVDYLLLF